MSSTQQKAQSELIPADKSAKSNLPKTLDSFASTANTSQLPTINTDDGQYAKYGWIALTIVFLFGGTWAATAPLNSAAVAIGEVVVVSHNKVVQHFEGGLVEAILVDEGDEVTQGQPLIRLSPTQAASELSMVTSQLNEALGLEARLRAEQQNATRINFPEALTSQLPNATIQEIIDSQQHVFKARRESLNAEQAVFNQRIRALEQQISGLSEYITTLDSRVTSFEAELRDWNELFLEQFADKMRVQEISRELDRLRGERSQNVSEIARLRVQMAETENQKILAKQQFLQEVVSELPRVQAQRIDLSFRKVILEDRLARIEITAPDNGVIKGLNVFTLGSVIRSGDTLMEIVPKREEFGLRVRVNPTNINTVNVGLLVDVRFSAFNTQTTHVVEGEVTHISADKFTDERQGVEYFEARIRITENGVEQMRQDGLFILPGMPVEAMIKTGERTVFGYFVKPFQDMFARSFRED